MIKDRGSLVKVLMRGFSADGIEIMFSFKMVTPVVCWSMFIRLVNARFTLFQ